MMQSMFFRSRFYTLSKSRAILKRCFDWYTKQWKSLPPPELAIFENRMERLDRAILAKKRQEADQLAKELEAYGHDRIHKSWFATIRDTVLAIAVALFFAILIRQIWFENYEIPTGSMRPSFKEHDHLIVSKTTFGLNVPLTASHLYFNPDSVKRGGAIIWSAEGVDMSDNRATYFGFIPSYKQVIKRVIGKPEDTLYFYGGKIFGLDKEGKQIEELAELTEEHYPIDSFQGRTAVIPGKSVTFSYFNQPTIRLVADVLGRPETLVYQNNEWVKADPATLFDRFGISNFGLARISLKENGATPYLEIGHHPTFTKMQLVPEVSQIALTEADLRTLLGGMTTSRFTIQKGQAAAYGHPGNWGPFLREVPDGTYEFDKGVAYSIGVKGWATALPKEHPLYKVTAEQVQTLFNLGIHFPPPTLKGYAPPRFAYFRDGDLYVAGTLLLKKEDERLQQFVSQEELKAKDSRYIPFKDAGPPTKETIEKWGLHIPAKNYIVLGDNPNNSQDSRSFGFLPEANIQGTPLFIFWPPGPRFGVVPNPNYPYITLPNMIVWGLFLLFLLGWNMRHRRKMRTPVYKNVRLLNS